MEKEQADFVKKTITLPDGRYLVYYDFEARRDDPQQSSQGPHNAAATAKEQ